MSKSLPNENVTFTGEEFLQLKSLVGNIPTTYGFAIEAFLRLTLQKRQQEKLTYENTENTTNNTISSPTTEENG